MSTIDTTFCPDMLEAAALRQDALAIEIGGLKRDANQAMIDRDLGLNTLIMKSLAILEAEEDIARYTVAIEKAKFRLQEAIEAISEDDLAPTLN